jgi:peptidoglycan/LPS O-acetylase OafA/YrhL
MAINYRREIDGLRAIAVLPVIFFHAGFQTFRGGFVGVDVFFVISGYLITSIIISEKQAGTFSLLNFYERRARRLLPALYVVMLACTPFAWMLMLPDDFENFGQSLVATTLFGNNVLLWHTADYFGLPSQFKPLVHTWSLGVEEQYYLLFPLLLLFLISLRNHLARTGLVVLGVVSLALAQWGSVNAPVATFYLIHARGWELIIGSFLAFYRFRKNAVPIDNKNGRRIVSEAVSLFGLFLIAYSILVFDKYTPFPSLHTLVPTLGAALVVLFADGETWAGRILGSKLLVGIGLISYSAYLWSNPLFAFARIASLDEPSSSVYLICIAITFLLAVVTWQYVEKPFRRKEFIERKRVLLLSLIVGGVIASAGWIIHANSGFVHLWPELNTDLKDTGRRLNATYNEKPFQFKGTKFSGDRKNNVLILGNSFARDFINAGLENAYFSSSNVSYSDIVPTCISGEQDIAGELRSLIAQSDYLIFGNPGISLKCWEQDFEILQRIGVKKIIVVGAKNFGWNPNAFVRLSATERKSYRAKVMKEVWDNNNAVAHALPDTVFVNLLALMADRDHRVPFFTDEGKIISQDKDHLTKEGAKFVGRILFEHHLLAPLK